MEPVREIPIQTLSVSGRFPSRKNKRMVAYESQLELVFIYHLEFSREVREYVEQPLRVESPNGGFYIPDFLVIFTDPLRKPLLAEIKYLRDVNRDPDRVLAKLAALQRFAREKGYDFKLFTDRELLTDRLKNYRFLYGYLSPPVRGDDYYEFTGNVVELVKREQPIRVIEVANILGKGDFLLRGLYLSTVWHLIANSVLWADLDEELTSHSFVYVTKPAGVSDKCLL